ncbi:MAG TPA: tyrosine-type recombinase/integrase [Anaerolineae bacterium]|nr:tyrosine-type recombinase/integrase [Anaerolineae bacterium]
MDTLTLTTTEQTSAARDALAIVERADLADGTKRKYAAALVAFLGMGGDLLDAGALAVYADTLSESGKSQLKAAVRLYSNAMLDRLKARADPDNVDFVRAAEYRTEALQNAIAVKTPKGDKAHTWLTALEVKQLLDTCGDDLQGQRDRLALGVLVAAGLRRAEAVNLVFADVILQPVRGKMRTVLQVAGKGSKDRVVPIRDSLANAIDAWAAATRGSGRILRSVDQGGHLGDGLSAVGLFHLVQGHGQQVGKPDLAPHDLRRTYAQLGYEAGVPVTQISRLLGHANIATTQRYLNLALDLTTTVSDFIPF